MFVCERNKDGKRVTKLRLDVQRKHIQRRDLPTKYTLNFHSGN